MKPLVLVFFFASLAAAQTATERTFAIPDFKVTEQSLAKALPKKQSMFVYPPELRKLSAVSVAKPQTYCLAMRSYNFDKSATPRLVSETNCTMVNPNGFLRVRR